MLRRTSLPRPLRNSLSGERFLIGSVFSSRPPDSCRTLLPRYFKSAVQAFWNTQRPMPGQHPSEREFLWLRLLEWTDEKLFQTPIAEGWRHALGYYAMRDPRMDQLRAHWKRSRRAWKLQPPAVLPSFESWRASAFPIR